MEQGILCKVSSWTLKTHYPLHLKKDCLHLLDRQSEFNQHSIVAKLWE